MLFGANSSIWEVPVGEDKTYLAEHVASLGFDVLEICIDDPFRISAPAIRRAAEEAGVGISVRGTFGPDRDVSHEDSDRRQTGIDYLKFCVDVAAEVGSANVSGPMYSAGGKVRPLSRAERDQRLKWATQSLRETGLYAGERGVGLVIEPLNRYETDMVNTVEQGVDLCERIGLDNVGLLLNTFHMNVEEKSIPDAIRLAGLRLRHFYACENDRREPGSGHIEWDEAFSALAEVGFDGLVVIEFWRPVAPSGDDLAREGLAFLREKIATRSRET